ncbi:hypothetical protein EYF80_006296 [Liparis tanakae]|uniref:Uncharacterized protein n=1 Tax=Liparis tanakae TaxID=230148 RepID=A0A4Z2IZ81_9TELE|nr:hypothetical protein EYF80_006296 [Liparis tanakae]
MSDRSIRKSTPKDYNSVQLVGSLTVLSRRSGSPVLGPLRNNTGLSGCSRTSHLDLSTSVHAHMRSDAHGHSARGVSALQSRSPPSSEPPGAGQPWSGGEGERGRGGVVERWRCGGVKRWRGGQRGGSLEPRRKGGGGRGGWMDGDSWRGERRGRFHAVSSLISAAGNQRWAITHFQTPEPEVPEVSGGKLEPRSSRARESVLCSRRARNENLQQQKG